MSTTFYLAAQADGDRTELTPNPAGAHYPNANDATHAAWNSALAAAQADLYVPTPQPGYDILSITSVTPFYDYNCLATSSVVGVVKLYGTELEAATQRFGTAAWATQSEGIGRPGGGSWTPEDLQSVQYGVRCKVNVGNVDNVKIDNVRLRVICEIRPALVSNPGDGILKNESPSPDPKRFLIGIGLSATTQAYIDNGGFPTRIVSLGPITLAGQKYPVWVTLGQQSVVNHP